MSREHLQQPPSNSGQKVPFIAIVAVWFAMAVTTSSAETPVGVNSLRRIAVCHLQGDDLPQSPMWWVSELIQREVGKADSLGVVKELLAFNPEAEEVRAAAAVGADKVITGRVASIARSFVVELRLIDVESKKVEAQERLVVPDSLLDPLMAVRITVQRLLHMGGVDSIPEAYINISSTPEGAKVFVEDLLEGHAPLSLRVMPGSHHLKAILPGYSPWVLDVNLKKGESLSLNAALAGALSATKYKSTGGLILRGFLIPYTTILGEAVFYVVKVESPRPYLGWALTAPFATYFITSKGLSNVTIDVGRACAIVSSGLWGAAWGILGAGASGLDKPRPYIALSIATSVTGMLVANGVTAGREVSRKRISFINSGAFMGSAVGLGVPYLLNANGSRIYNLGLMVGGILGASLAAGVTANLDYVSRWSWKDNLQLAPCLWTDLDVRGAVPPDQTYAKGTSTRHGLQLSIALN